VRVIPFCVEKKAALNRSDQEEKNEPAIVPRLQEKGGKKERLKGI